MKSVIASSVIASLWLAASLRCAAQESYPVRPVTIVVPFSAGSQPDILARTLAEAMAKSTSQPVVVLNREGAAGTIAVASVAQARPDGYTLGFGPNGQFSIQTHLLRDLAYKVEQFDFLCQTNSGAYALVVGPGSPYKTLAELIDAARRAPGKLNLGSIGHATIPHLVGESIGIEATVKFTHVPFKASGDMITQTLNGSVDFTITTPAALAGGSALRALALVAENRSPRYPEVPLLKEQGFKRSSLPGYIGLYGLKGIPADAAGWLRRSCAQSAETPGFRQASEKVGAPQLYADAPAYNANMIEDHRYMGELLRTLGVKPQ